MAHGRNTYQSRENQARVREILMREWDPIGVADEPEAADEYDGYVGTVYVMLMERRVGKEEISAYLYDIATGHMGLSTHPLLMEKCERTAEILLQTRPEFETH